jgi:BirA family transcriptional regulator, biotin operon repressor / biotin---[acetyl-CoA-carboxylase] ligase
MDQPSLEATLADLNLPAIRYYESIGSTNDEAWKWIEAGAPNQALVIANEQTAGRGRAQRRWITVPGAGLAFSLILLSPPLDPFFIPRLTGLGAVAIQKSLIKKYAIPAEIKWPNDILVNARKVAGVLVEAHWDGETLIGVIVGIGINIAPESVSEDNLPAIGLNFPATCLENELGRPIGRQALLHATVDELLTILPSLSLPKFMDEWEAGLAFRGQWVELSYGLSTSSTQAGSAQAIAAAGKVIGLTQDGSLKLLTSSGKIVTAAVGELQLKPAPAG